MSDLARSRLQVSNVQKSWKLFRKARGAGEREGTSSFSATTNFSKSRASYFRLACFRDVLLSESLAQATCDHLPKKSYHLLRTTPMQSTNDWSILEICRVQLPFHFRAQSFLYALALGFWKETVQEASLRVWRHTVNPLISLLLK